jgi:hypothetical protein
MPSVEYVRWIAVATIPVAFVIGLSRYPAPSYLDRVPRVKDGVRLCLLVAYTVCCAFHLSLMAIATGLLTGVMPEQAIGDLSAMATVVAVALLLIWQGVSMSRGRPSPSPDKAEKDPMNYNKEGSWPSLLAMEFSYFSAVLSVLGNDTASAWIQTTLISSVVMVLLFLAFSLALYLLRGAIVKTLGTYMDDHYMSSAQKQGCRMLQPHFTWVALFRDFFAAWPIVNTLALAGGVALSADVNNLRARSEWTRLIPYLQYPPIVAILTAGMWQWNQPLYHTEETS